MSHKDHDGTALTSGFGACLATSRPDPGRESRFSRSEGVSSEFGLSRICASGYVWQLGSNEIFDHTEAVFDTQFAVPGTRKQEKLDARSVAAAGEFAPDSPTSGKCTFAASCPHHTKADWSRRGMQARAEQLLSLSTQDGGK